MGFQQCPDQEGDRWKAAFATKQGLYEPQVIFFSLCNSPATFQKMMNDILPDFISQGVAICYMNILIFTKTLTLHHQITLSRGKGNQRFFITQCNIHLYIL